MSSPGRSDARRNRTAILRAADEALTRGDEPLSLSEIARLAGVGQATVYRHFADRGALAVAVMREQIAGLTRLVEDQQNDPAGFRQALRVVLSKQARMRPLVALLTQLPPQEQKQLAEQLLDTLRLALRGAREAGLVRSDLRTGDLLRLLAMVEAAIRAAAEIPDPQQREAAIARAVDVLVDGVCPA